MFTIVATHRLMEAGYRVTAADGIPGLWNVEGLAYDVTTAQLCQLAEEHGKGWPSVLPAKSLIHPGILS